jgi:hypothetical protein
MEYEEDGVLNSLLITNWEKYDKILGISTLYLHLDNFLRVVTIIAPTPSWFIRLYTVG